MTNISKLSVNQSTETLTDKKQTKVSGYKLVD